MFEVLENPANKSHLDFWRRVTNTAPGAQHDSEQTFSACTAAVDHPACCVWRELTRADPQAKLLLTDRRSGAEASDENTMDTICFTEAMRRYNVPEFATPFGRKFGDLPRRLIWQRSHCSTMNHRTGAIAHGHQPIADAKAAVPADRLMVFSADPGWPVVRVPRRAGAAE